MNTTTRPPIEMPRDALRALDKLLAYTAYDEMKHYDECVSDGSNYGDHIWIAIRHLLEWRAGLSDVRGRRFRELLKEADEWATARKETIN